MNGSSQRVRGAPDGDALLLHRLEQRRLGLRRRAVDLVGEQELREDRALLELEVPAARVVLRHDLRADDVRGHEVGRELDARELQVQRVGQRLHQQRLAQARDAFEQHMAGREQAGEYAVDEVVMTDDAPLGSGA